MPGRLALILCIALVASPNAFARSQQQPPPPKPSPDQPAPPPRRDPPGQPINVRVDLAIADQFATGDPLKKTVTMMAENGARSSVRNDVGNRGFLNADAQPHLLPSGAIRLVLRLEYMPSVSTAGADAVRTLSRLNQQITVILESGKPLVVSQAADPTSDRKVTIQVTATIVK